MHLLYSRLSIFLYVRFFNILHMHVQIFTNRNFTYILMEHILYPAIPYSWFPRNFGRMLHFHFVSCSNTVIRDKFTSPIIQESVWKWNFIITGNKRDEWNHFPRTVKVPEKAIVVHEVNILIKHLFTWPYFKIW